MKTKLTGKRRFFIGHIAIAAALVAFFQNCSDFEPIRPNEANFGSGFSSLSAKACSFGETLVPSGASLATYPQDSVSFGSECSSIAVQRSCDNGVLTGPEDHVFLTCMPRAPVSCIQGTTVVPHGESRIFYSSALANAGQTCGGLSMTRTCTNGILSGSANYSMASCSTASSCSLGGLTVGSGQSITAYNSPSVGFGQSCASTTRTCQNGNLGGDTAYQYSSCSANARDPRCPANQISLNFEVSESTNNITIRCNEATQTIGIRVTVAPVRTCSLGFYTSAFSSDPPAVISCSGPSAGGDFTPGVANTHAWQPYSGNGINGSSGMAYIEYNGGTTMRFFQNDSAFLFLSSQTITWDANGNFSHSFQNYATPSPGDPGAPGD